MTIDYEEVLNAATSRELPDLVRQLTDLLPERWMRAYKAITQQPTNIVGITAGSFEYLFDYSAELVAKGQVSATEATCDRLVAVHETSCPPEEVRNRSRMRGFPRGAAEVVDPDGRCNYDRGHLIARSIGGGMDMNLFPQRSDVNRGRSKEGQLFRRMERFCEQHPGTYCFARPLYLGKMDHPVAVEFGLLRSDGTLWINLFQNAASQEEAVALEALVRDAIEARHRQTKG